MELDTVLEVQVARHPLVVAVGLELVRVLQAVVGQVHDARVGGDRVGALQLALEEF